MSKIANPERNYLCAWKDKRYESKSIRRFLKEIRTIKWKELKSPVYLKVYYGKKIDSYGKLTGFWNDGEYTTKADFDLALEAFLE